MKEKLIVAWLRKNLHDCAVLAFPEYRLRTMSKDFAAGETPRPIYFTLACGWQNRICSAAEEEETMRSVEYGLLASPMSVFLNLRSWTEL